MDYVICADDYAPMLDAKGWLSSLDFALEGKPWDDLLKLDACTLR